MKLKQVLGLVVLLVTTLIAQESSAYSYRQLEGGGLEVFCGSVQPPNVASSFGYTLNSLSDARKWAKANCPDYGMAPAGKEIKTAKPKKK